MELVIPLFFALVVTLLFILVLRPVAMAISLVDAPGGRKKHKKSTPVIGGMAMYFGFLFGGILLGEVPAFGFLLVGSSLLILVGAIDDGLDLPPTVRLIAQTCAVLVMIYGADIRLSNIGSPLFFDFELGAFSVPFTMLVTLTVINAFNIIDGIDGLAGGVAFIAIGFMAIFSIGSDILSLASLLMAVVGGFLICNFPIYSSRDVKCFMGDAGSTFLGFMVAFLGISLSQSGVVSMSAVTALWLVAVPIFDVVTSVLRRIISGKSPFGPDRDHLHHVLMNEGMSSKRTLLIILLFSCITASIGFIGEILIVPDGVMFLLWFSLGLMYFGDIAFYKGQRLIGIINRLQWNQQPLLTQNSIRSSSKD